MAEDWSGVRVLVTGSTQGIGLGIARCFAARQAKVAISGRSSERCAAGRDALATEGLTVETVSGDVSTRAGCQAMVTEAIDKLGGLDVLCTNAGIYPDIAIEDLTEADVATIIDTNLKGTIFSVQAALPALKQSGRGRVVITSSITGPVTGYNGLSVYAATKAGQQGFARTAALELAPYGITINSVSPGSIETPGLAELGSEAVASMVGLIPVKRLGKPDDIGEAAVYFASLGAGFVTGQDMVVDGGQVLPEIPGLA
jgi:3-oxoacyl-[acyl-carrier protein] reductase